MKKIITLFIIAILCFSLASCAKTIDSNTATAPENEVTTEPFESMEISYNQMSMFKTYDSLDELTERAELIVIASPEKTFTDEAPTFLDINGNPVDSYEQASNGNRFTKRQFKVYKVLKGDKNLKEVTVAETFAYNESTDKIVGFEGEYIAKKNAKYLLFLIPSNYTDSYYVTCYNVGKINIDGKDPNCEQVVDNKMLNEIKKEYKNEFKETK